MKKLRKFLAMILSAALIVGTINVKAYAKEDDDLNSIITNITLQKKLLIQIILMIMKFLKIEQQNQFL